MGKDETMGKIFENFTIFVRRSWIMFPVVDFFFFLQSFYCYSNFSK